MKKTIFVLATIIISSFLTQGFTSKQHSIPVKNTASPQQKALVSYISIGNNCNSGVFVLVVAAGSMFNPVHNQTGSWPVACAQDFCDTNVSGSQSVYVYIDYYVSGSVKISCTDANSVVQCQQITGNGWYTFNNVQLSSLATTTIIVQAGTC